MKKHIPNFITLLNLLSGCIAIIFALNSNFTTAALFVGIGIIFDFLDGFLARLLNVKSDLGIQLDSLADLVTSGVVPGIVMFKLLELAIGAPELTQQTETWNAIFSLKGLNSSVIPMAGFAITLASAYRLAKFNIDQDQQSYFKGLPTPANALLILSLPLILEFQNIDLMNIIILNPYFLIIITLFSCYLLNAPIKLFSLKFKSNGFAENASRYIFLALCVITLAVFQFAAIPVIIAIYIGMSVLDNISDKKNVI